MNIKVVCSNCEKEINCGNDEKEMVKVEQRNITSVTDNKELTATYFNCPYCNHEHIVQLDDSNTKKLFNETIIQMKNKVILSRQGKNVSKKESKNFKRNRNLLSLYRTELMRKYDQGLFKEESGDKFVLNCTMGFMNE